MTHGEMVEEIERLRTNGHEIEITRLTKGDGFRCVYDGATGKGGDQIAAFRAAESAAQKTGGRGEPKAQTGMRGTIPDEERPNAYTGPSEPPKPATEAERSADRDRADQKRSPSESQAEQSKPAPAEPPTEAEKKAEWDRLDDKGARREIPVEQNRPREQSKPAPAGPEPKKPAPPEPKPATHPHQSNPAKKR